jgi:hypothetical protein
MNAGKIFYSKPGSNLLLSLLNLLFIHSYTTGSVLSTADKILLSPTLNSSLQLQNCDAKYL